MNLNQLKSIDYLFLKFKSVTPKLEDIAEEYYPHLSKEKVLEKARQQKFPFTCFRIDESQKGPFFVEINELAQVLDDLYKKGYQNFKASTQNTIKS